MTWPPIDENDLQRALQSGDISESNRLDFKATVGDSNSTRRETAKDMASFAVNGGALLIGVAENKELRTFAPAPVNLHDIIERIEQIAANRIDPPLVVHPREIPTEDSDNGYVWVEIPASPDAPHMVDGKYYGRGERTNRTLTDADVLRLHQSRTNTADKARDALNAIQAKDPYPPARGLAATHEGPTPRNGHLYIVATPRRADSRLAETLIWERQAELYDFIGRAHNAVPQALNAYGPHLSGFALEARAGAVSFTNLSGIDLRAVPSAENNGLDIRIADDGSIGFTVMRISTPGNERDAANVLDGAVLANAYRFLSWVQGVAASTGYTGHWDVGIRATNLQGRSASVFSGSGFFGHEGSAYEQDTYERLVSVSRTDLVKPDNIVTALARPLLRGLSSWEYWKNSVPQLDGN